MQMWIKNYRGIAFAVLALLLFGLAGAMVLPFVPALLWALVLSILTYPLYERFRTRFAKVRWLGDGRSDTVASLAVTLLTLLIICVPFFVIGLGIFLQMGGVANQLNGDGLSLEQVLKQVDTAIDPIMSRIGADAFNLSEYVMEHKEDILQGARQPLQKFASQAGVTVLTLVFALLTQFFMLRDGNRLIEPTVQLSPLPATKTRDLLQRIITTVKAVFVGTVLVALLQGAVIGVTYALVGVPNALLLGVVSAILCIIPLLGAPVVYIPVGGFLFLQGKTVEALVVLGVGFVIVSQIDNVIKPFLIGGQVKLHPMAIFFAILGGVIVFGPIGVMAGPMILTIILALVESVRESLPDGKVVVQSEG